MNTTTKLAKSILEDNQNVLYGIFGVVVSSSWFQPANFLNELLQGGGDPCDQDGRMPTWSPFSLTAREYEEVKQWWLELHPQSQVSDLGVEDWSEWSFEIIHGDRSEQSKC